MWQLSEQGEASAEGKKEKGEKKREHEKEGRDSETTTQPSTTSTLAEQINKIDANKNKYLIILSFQRLCRRTSTQSLLPWPHIVDFSCNHVVKFKLTHG